MKLYDNVFVKAMASELEADGELNKDLLNYNGTKGGLAIRTITR